MRFPGFFCALAQCLVHSRHNSGVWEMSVTKAGKVERDGQLK